MFAEINPQASALLPFALMTLCKGRAQESIFRRHGYEYHQILWVTKGQCTYQLMGETFTLTAGEGIYMRPHIPHRYDGEDLSTAWCTFTVSEGLLDFLGIGDYLHFKVPASMDQETDQLLRFALGDSTVLSRSAAGYAYVINFFSKILGKEESFCTRVLHLLEMRYADPLTLSEIAEELQVNKYTLCRRYKQEQGTTVIEDLTRIRIEKAKQMLRYNVSTVKEIGELCGFESPSYFGKQFRERVGCTPAEYRRKFS